MHLCQTISCYREHLKPFLAHYRRMQTLKRKKQILSKKISLLKKLKAYSKDIYLTIENIDQAFFVERNKQKTYNHFVRRDETVQKVQLFKKFKERINMANKNTIRLMDQSLRNWIDKGQFTQKKHMEKTLILLYFVRNEPMYRENNLTYSLDSINDKKKLWEQLKVIKKWPDYKYVNDKSIKEKVRQFLRSLIAEVTPEEERGRTERILVTMKTL